MTELLEKLHLRRAHPRPEPDPIIRALYKRDRRRFWILTGICLVIGLAGYFWYTSARILTRPIELDFGPHTSEFAASFGALVDAEFSRGNEFQTFVNGDEFVPAMLAAIRDAKKSVTLETYIWAPGKMSDMFIAALTERARAGVKVNVLVDAMGTLKFRREDLEKLRDAGVEFATYGRKHWYEVNPNINHRTHRKILIVDGRIGFTGGMCIDDHWLGAGDKPDVWRDTEVRVEGPAVRQMQGVFATNWLQTTARLIVGPDYFPEIRPAGDSIAEAFKSGPGEDTERARIAYLLAIASARKSIKISHAYFVPDDLATRMLLAARRRGVAIDIIVPARNDSRFGRAASRSRWGPLLAAGVKFHLFEPAMYHCKSMIVDDSFVTVGSVNFDNRSFAINDEMNVSILDPAIAREHLRIFDQDLARSRPLTLADYEHRPFYIKLADWFCGLFRSQL
jgi:cardiolipin synthase